MLVCGQVPVSISLRDKFQWEGIGGRTAGTRPLPHLSSGLELTHTQQSYPQGPTPSWPSAYLNVLGHIVLKDSHSIHSHGQYHPAQRWGSVP